MRATLIIAACVAAVLSVALQPTGAALIDINTRSLRVTPGDRSVTFESRRRTDRGREVITWTIDHEADVGIRVSSDVVINGQIVEPQDPTAAQAKSQYAASTRLLFTKFMLYSEIDGNNGYVAGSASYSDKSLVTVPLNNATASGWTVFSCTTASGKAITKEVLVLKEAASCSSSIITGVGVGNGTLTFTFSVGAKSRTIASRVFKPTVGKIDMDFSSMDNYPVVGLNATAVRLVGIARSRKPLTHTASTATVPGSLAVAAVTGITGGDATLGGLPTITYPPYTSTPEQHSPLTVIGVGSALASTSAVDTVYVDTPFNLDLALNTTSLTIDTPFTMGYEYNKDSTTQTATIGAGVLAPSAMATIAMLVSMILALVA